MHSLAKKFNFGSLILFALPTTIMMMIMSLYTIVDGVFISRFVGTNALSSSNIVYPIVNIVIGVAIMFSTGSNAIIAKKMGEGKYDEARKVFSMILVLGIGFGIIFAVLGNIFAKPMVELLGASPVLMKDCITYISILLAFCPAFVLQMLFQVFFVTEGRPMLGMILTILAGITNAVFDYIFIVPMHLGIAGAAYATSMGYMVPAVFGLLYFFRSRKNLYLVKPSFKKEYIINTCANGSSEMVINISTGIVTFAFNILMMKFAGEDGVAAITIIQYAQFSLSALFIGFAQGVAPIISFNYGAKNHSQLKEVFRISMICIGVSSILILILSYLCGPFLVTIFAKAGTHVYTLANHGFIIFAINFLFAGFNIFGSGMFTAFSNGKVSAFLSLIRTFGLILVALLVLPIFLGIDGVWIAVPVAEFGCLFVTLFYFKKYKNVYHYM